ncbi:hypothetical protein AA103196_2815 [Ameyamaea chiangmaiensis NBRC 103196]|uniref:Glycosyltransferase n=1 Tax=Ameyamaea chiangmaiensis TaxID=442969 RepID=A0A850PE84_9PROT|nr:hypothetical protein [Ameyamaea chiangmaiensis]MBS4074305.1 hypothetical protein [Ameyamaea chiangmaiensis]NVN41183.1 hypothetical protein [Ameyamaea chiangmaiensis]GBQ71584.1 hypothetical protein AA103196_2815 [Ameyamaea chiangmaiensis NBRC 103196]
MKWFFAITGQTLADDPDHGFIDCIRVAVKSAHDNTSLKPHMVFDGEECDFTREMRAAGVTVIFHRLHFFDRLHEAQKRQKPEWPNYMRTAAGAFLRLDLPLIETQDQYVLYTDCDVMFTAEPALEFCKPEIFAACGQFGQQDYYSDMNSGVMLINLHRLGRDLPALVEFLCDNLYHIAGYDQELLRVFYNAQWSPLSAKYNWKPYWGPNADARIVHFHGPKAPASRRLIEDATYREHDPSFHTWRHWFFQNPDGYRHYVPAWETFLKQPYAHEKTATPTPRKRAARAR